MCVIDSRKVDQNFKNQIASEPGSEGILKCYACGSCTAQCPEMNVKFEWAAEMAVKKMNAKRGD
jgi:heterodisulfide reductase subunit C